DSLTNVSGSTPPSEVVGQSRGMAPGAQLFALPLNASDTLLQETAARTNALFATNKPFISNNSWSYGDNEYDLACASYDAAVRDTLPGIPGSQPAIYVFAAGNSGSLNRNIGSADDGTGG